VMYEGLGQVRSEQGQRRESLARFGQAIESLGTAVAGNPRIAFFRRSLARAYDRFGGASRGFEPSAEHAALLTRVAGILATCSASTAAIGPEPAGDPVSESRLFADGAVASLRSALAAGFPDLDQIRRDPRFARLRSREDLRTLLNEEAEPSTANPARD